MDTKLNEKQNLLSRAIDSANLLAFCLDTQGNIAACNKKVQEVTGMPADQIVGRHWLKIFVRDEAMALKQQMLKAVIDDSISYKRANSFEGIITDSTGSERFISWNISPVFSQEQQLEGVFLAGNDVTESKEREQSLKKIDDTIKNILSSIKEYALYVINLEGNITYFGMGAEQLLGWQKNEIIFKHINILHINEDTTGVLPAMLEQIKTSGEYEAEILLVKKDGTKFPAILTAHKFLDPSGNLSGYLFIAKDVTERKKLEYQVFQAEKLAALGQLTAGVAHEINNPLFVISGRLELILEDSSLSESLRADLKTISTQADRIRTIIDRLLKFARQRPPKLQSVDLNALIEGIFPLLSYQKLPVSKAVLEKKYTEAIPPIKADPGQLQEVLINLVVNAYQAMPEGGTLSVKTAIYQQQFAEIRISDTGTGIAPANLKNMFMPFFTTKKEGTGLGLSICYNIIRNHNGTIEVESAQNQGTTFIIRLPLEKEYTEG